MVYFFCPLCIQERTNFEYNVVLFTLKKLESNSFTFKLITRPGVAGAVQKLRKLRADFLNGWSKLKGGLLSRGQPTIINRPGVAGAVL